MLVLLDDFVVYRCQQEHLDQLRLCLDQCRTSRLSLNLAKCAFNVSNGALLGHIMSREGIAMDPDKVNTILVPPAPTTAKALSHFLGQIRWHKRMLRHLADFPGDLPDADIFRITATPPNPDPEDK